MTTYKAYYKAGQRTENMKYSHAPVTTFNTFRNSIEFEFLVQKKNNTNTSTRQRAHTHRLAESHRRRHTCVYTHDFVGTLNLLGLGNSCEK